MFISVSSQTTLLNTNNFFVFALYDATNPTVVLESQQPPKPYGNPLQISFTYNCLNGHIYDIKLWESADSTPTGVVRNSFSQTINANSVNIRLDEYWQVGVTTGLASGVNTFVKADIGGWDLSLERKGQGTMSPQSATDITVPDYMRTNADNSANDQGDKITLLASGDVFQPNEVFIVRFDAQIISTQAGTPSSIFSTGKIITADTTLFAADSSQALFIQSATTTININLPSLSSIQDYTFFYIYSIGGSQINTVVRAGGVDKFLYNNALQFQIILGQSEVLKVFPANGVWNIDNDLQGVRQAGESFNGYAVPINAVPAAGQLLLRSEYPRLWQYVQQLSSGLVVTDTSWNSTFYTRDGVTYYTNKGYYSSGTVTSGAMANFRVPLKIGMTAKGVDATSRMPGSFENEQGIAHQHMETIGTLPVTLFGTGATLLGGGYQREFTQPVDLASQPTDPEGNILNRFGTHNLVDNIGEIAMIRI